MRRHTDVHLHHHTMTLHVYTIFYYASLVLSIFVLACDYLNIVFCLKLTHMKYLVCSVVPVSVCYYSSSSRTIIFSITVLVAISSGTGIIKFPIIVPVLELKIFQILVPIPHCHVKTLVCIAL